MIKLSNGVELSENTIVAALEKAGINVEPVKPKHIFKPGDVAKRDNLWRLIISFKGTLYAVDKYGTVQGVNNLDSEQGQAHFEKYDYKYIGRQSDLLDK